MRIGELVPLAEMGEFKVTMLNQTPELFRVLDLRRQPNPL
jgi:hypothetical protein